MNGIYNVVQRAYDSTLRPVLPRRTVTENGMRVKRAKLLDRYQGRDDYEGPLIEGVRQETTDGDYVCIVGGGWGVSACHAVECGGKPVDVFEPGDEQINHCRETIQRNVNTDGVRVHHAAIGTAENVYGETTADVLAPDELPECDILVLDCEGAELEILAGMIHRPDVVVVEVHPTFGVFEASVSDALTGMGYTIVDREVVENDDRIIILTGKCDSE